MELIAALLFCTISNQSQASLYSVRCFEESPLNAPPNDQNTEVPVLMLMLTEGKKKEQKKVDWLGRRDGTALPLRITMCSYCKPFLACASLAPAHTALECPLKQAAYCGICAANGHTTEECPAERMLYFRNPTSFEQLLHPGELEAYGLETSVTPLPAPFRSPPPAKDPRMIVPEYKDSKLTDRAIQGILRAHGIQPGNMKTNRERIQKLAMSKGLRLVWQEA